jgi:predicted DCC family thiol-disulfide oxidoreductase YuxK
MSGRLLVLFDGDCGICTHTARLLRRMDRAGRLDLRPLDTWDETADGPDIDALRAALHVRDAHGRWVRGGAAVAAIAREIPITRPLGLLGRLPIARTGLEAGYAVVSRNRHRISRRFRLTACAVEALAPGTRR